jgi:effector-binding domain-containing protein
MPSRFFHPAVAGVLAFLTAASLAGVGRTEETLPSASSAPAAPTSHPPAASAQSPSGQPPATGQSIPPQAPTGAAPTPPETKQGEASTGETVELQARPFAYVEGKAGRDDIYGAVLASLALVKRDIEKAGLRPAGRPLAVFVGSDDSGFQYHAGYPLEAAPQGDVALPDAVKVGQTPSGKAMRFEHLGSYADIDGTYDAITAYLDEKGIDAQDSFVEEYANDVKDPDDPALRVNIYVLLK